MGGRAFAAVLVRWSPPHEVEGAQNGGSGSNCLLPWVYAIPLAGVGWSIACPLLHCGISATPGTLPARRFRGTPSGLALASSFAFGLTAWSTRSLADQDAQLVKPVLALVAIAAWRAFQWRFDSLSLKLGRLERAERQAQAEPRALARA
jgi:hypothetical protein